MGHELGQRMCIEPPENGHFVCLRSISAYTLGMLRLSPPEHWPEAVRRSSEIVTLRKGEMIFQEGDGASHLYHLCSGHVRLFRLTGQDREVTLCVASQGQWLSEGSLSGVAQPFFAESLDAAVLLRIPIQPLLQAARVNMELAQFLVQIVTSQISLLQKQHQQLVFQDVAQRLATTLLTLASQSKMINGKLSHQDLAYMVGSTRETITKLLGEFRDLGLLELGYRKIGLLDEEGLRRLATERQ